MKTKLRHSIRFIPFGLLVLCSELSSAQNTQVSWSAFDMGFTVSSNASNISTKSVVGQMFVGPALLANSRVDAGFLADTLIRGPVVAVKEQSEIPANFALHQNYPNPFNPSTTIKFSVEKTDRATLDVYNILGQHIARLYDEAAEAGVYHTVRFDAANFASGTYICRLQSGGKSQVRKFLLLR